MLKRSLLVALLACVLFLTGCETLKEGTAEGVKKDFQNTLQADTWFKDNLW